MKLRYAAQLGRQHQSITEGRSSKSGSKLKTNTEKLKMLKSTIRADLAGRRRFGVVRSSGPSESIIELSRCEQSCR